MKSAIHLRLAAGAGSLVEHVGGNRWPAAHHGRMAGVASRPCPQGLLAHQSPDPMQPAGQCRRPAGRAIHASPRRFGRSQRSLSAPWRPALHRSGLLAARSCQPGIEAAPRDPERPAQPSRRPGSPVLRDEPELHIDPSRSRPRLFLDVSFGLQFGQFTLSTALDSACSGFNCPWPGKARRITPTPSPNSVASYDALKIAGRLGVRHPAIPDQSHSSCFELP